MHQLHQLQYSIILWSHPAINQNIISSQRKTVNKIMLNHPVSRVGCRGVATLGIDKIPDDGDPDIIDLVIRIEPNQFEFAEFSAAVRCCGTTSTRLWITGASMSATGSEARPHRATHHNPRVRCLEGKLRPAICY